MALDKENRSVQSHFTLQCIYAEKKCKEGNKGKAAGLYKSVLQAFGSQSTYLAVHSRFALGWLK